VINGLKYAVDSGSGGLAVYGNLCAAHVSPGGNHRAFEYLGMESVLRFEIEPFQEMMIARGAPEISLDRGNLHDPIVGEIDMLEGLLLQVVPAILPLVGPIATMGTESG